MSEDTMTTDIEDAAMSEQATESTVEVPAFIVNLIGRLVAENEAVLLREAGI